MNAGSIMERFATMTDEEKASLKAYEAAHKTAKESWRLNERHADH